MPVLGGGGDTALRTGSHDSSSALSRPSSSSFPPYHERVQQELMAGRGHQTRISDDARRIRWTLNGPLETSISIVNLGREFDPEEVPEALLPRRQGRSRGQAHLASLLAFTAQRAQSVVRQVVCEPT